jgi:hypothetical protein
LLLLLKKKAEAKASAPQTKEKSALLQGCRYIPQDFNTSALIILS